MLEGWGKTLELSYAADRLAQSLLGISKLSPRGSEIDQTYSTLRALKPFLIMSKWSLSSVYSIAPMDIAAKAI